MKNVSYIYRIYRILVYISIYLYLVSIFSVLTFTVTFIKGFDDPDKRYIRGILFFGLGASALIPFIHLIIFEIHGEVNEYRIINKLIAVSSYLIGVLIYVMRFPECKWPGRFCYVGSSHQLWHTLIVLAIVFTYLAALDAYNSRMKNAICPVVY